MLTRHVDHPSRPRKDFDSLGHFAIGTADLKNASVLQKYDRDLWSSSAQKPMLYAYAKGGEVIEHEDGKGKGHRRTLAEVQKLDYSYHGN
jgi:hypothetical protein